MRYGVFSDIHSNLEAMTAVAAAMKAEEAQEYLCLGDLVGYYANPIEVIELIETLRCWKMVLGNHDSGCLGKTPLANFNPPAAQALTWTQARLKPQHLKFLESLRLREEIGEIQLVHSSPFQSGDWHYLSKKEDIDNNFRYFEGALCLFGHIHEPFIAEQKQDGTVEILKDQEYVLKSGCRYLVNAGSVGQPRDGDPRACYVLYDSSTRKIAIRRVAYDFETTMKKTLAAGLSDYLANRLKIGK